MSRAFHRTGAPRLADESGIALASAIIVLMIVSILAAGGVTVALDTATSTTHDEQRKAALAAAEAGLRVASYRLTMLKPEKAQCITNSAVAMPEGATSYCAAIKESLGNGAEFTYQTTTALEAGEKCVGLQVVSQQTLYQRCIAATGTIKGVNVRVEARVAAFTGTSLFPYSKIGLIGLEGVTIKGNYLNIYNGLGSNGKITVEGNNIHQTDGCELGPSGSYRESGSNFEACKPSPKYRTPSEGELVLSPVNPGNSESGPCPSEPEAEPTGNCDGRILQGLLKAEGNAYTSPYDSFTSSGSVWIPSIRKELEEHRVLRLVGNKISLTLTGGVYNFCSLIVEGNNTSITVAPGVKAEIFVGSPGCPAGSGVLESKGNSLGSTSQESTALQIYVYGKGSVKIEGNSSSSTAAVIYAPESEVSVKGNSAKFLGGIAGRKLTIEGNAFEDGWQEEDGKLGGGNAGVSNAYYRTAWGQCTPEGTTPAEGC
jgi:Tfp pilus assembly protein PilX